MIPKDILEIIKSILTLYCCGLGILFVLVLGIFGKREILKSAHQKREKMFNYLFKEEIDESLNHKK